MAAPRARFALDPFTIAVAVTVGLASVLPSRGRAAEAFELVTDLAIALLFFLHGARLSRATVLAGLTHWRLHLLVLASTFAMFPLLGLLLAPLTSRVMSADLQAGFLFLCAVPSTVQSSIAFTALAGGNVAGAVCSASASSMIGVALTPLLVGALGLRASGTMSPGEVALGLLAQLAAPFVLGQLLHGPLAGFVERHRAKLRLIDQSAILLAVYTAFSAAMVQGLWSRVSTRALLGLLVFTIVLLAAALFLTWRASKIAGFSRGDEIVVVFCGSKKILASGVPFANVLFPAELVGALVLPLMLYHQLQLLVCAALARRYAAAAPPDHSSEGGSGVAR